MISPLGHGCGCGFRVDMEDASDGEVVRGVVCVAKGSVGEIVLGCGREQHSGGEGAALDRRALGRVVGGVRRRKPVRGEKAGESNGIQAGVFSLDGGALALLWNRSALKSPQMMHGLLPTRERRDLRVWQGRAIASACLCLPVADERQDKRHFSAAPPNPRVWGTRMALWGQEKGGR